MAAALVGGAFLSASLQVLFDRLASREVLNLFTKRKTNVDGLLKKLKRKLNLLNHVLDDADVKQFTDTNVRAWSDEARDAVYQADDVLSEITYEARRRQVESDPEYQSRMDQVNTTLISSSYFTSFDDYIEPKLGEILQLLEDLIQEAASLGLKEGVRPGANMPTNRSSSSLVVDVYGRDSEKKQLIDRLLLDETTVDVIPVVGMGGMGKTTLVQFAYNDHRVDKKFKTMKAWVCVSKQFDVLRATKTILESITGRRCTFTDLNQVQESLKKKLNGMKFLIVLDDVWNKNYGDWDTLRAPFRTGAPGSKIIVTTRIQDAADIMRSGPVINLAELSDDYCWQLFADIAFGESSPSSYPPQLEEIGRKIVKRCRGLPLAVKSLAGLLRSKQRYVGKWEDVLNSDFWDLPEDNCDILPALRFDGTHQHEITDKVRHCSYHDICGFQQLQAATKVTTLRTFLPIADVYRRVQYSAGLEIVGVLSRQKHMRVLALPCYTKINDLADLVGSLIHLQYLDLSRTNMKQLPESICRLYNLETLLLSWCSSLNSLPEHIGKLTSLRRLDIRGTHLKEMPIQLKLLKRLEYLPLFHVGKEGGLPIGGLKELNSLRGELGISGLENVGNKNDALEAKLVEKEHLEMLALEWGSVADDSRHVREVLDCLRPHRNLKDLKITNYGGTRFPDWLGDHLITQVVSLRLEDCSRCVLMPTLGQLACLKELSIKGMGSVTEVGEEFLGGINQPFPSLEALRFENMVEWVKWSLPVTGEFPKLRKLEIINCPKLVGTLPQVNIATFLIKIMNCPMLEALVPSSSSPPPSIAAPAGDAGKLKLQLSERVELNWLAMSDLVEVEISELQSLQVLTSELCALTKLKMLKVARCPNLLSLSNSGLPPMLTDVEIRECELLRSVVDGMVSHNTCRLQSLNVSFCPLLASFADNGLPTTLKDITFLSCPKLELSLSEGLEMCPLVEELTLYGCLSLNPLMLVKLFPNVRKLFTGNDDNLSILNVGGCPQLAGGRLANLTCLQISACKNLKALPEGMCDLLPSLEIMRLFVCQEIESIFEVSLLSKLRWLTISGCDKLTSFDSDRGLPSTLNPMGIRQLTSLERLDIRDCCQLESLPDEGLPPSLSTLEIKDCPLLTPRCKKDSGDYWPKIAHIPTIKLDGVFLSSA